MAFFRQYSEALVHPLQFFQQLKGNGPGGYTAGMLALPASLLALVSGWLLVNGVRGDMARTLFANLGLAAVLLSFLGLLFKTALFHLFASLWGRKGDVRVLIHCLLFSYLPFALLLPAALLFRAAGVDALFFLVLLLALGYGYRMEVAALQVVFKYPASRAFALFIMPLLVQMVFFLIIVLGFTSVVAAAALKFTGIL